MKKYILSLCVGLVIILPTISLAQGWVARYNGPGDSLERFVKGDVVVLPFPFSNLSVAVMLLLVTCALVFLYP